MTCEQLDVVVVSFPFTDVPHSKRRPALVLSTARFSARVGQSVMAMITSAGNPPWPLDTDIAELEQAGLPRASVVRMKLFTLDHRLVIRRAGALSRPDAQRVQRSLDELFGARRRR